MAAGRLPDIGQIAQPVEGLDRATTLHRDLRGLPLQFQVPGLTFFDSGGLRLMLSGARNREPLQPGLIHYFRAGDIQGALMRFLAEASRPLVALTRRLGWMTMTCGWLPSKMVRAMRWL